LAFQPKLNLETGLVESAECLMRWTHPDFGAIPPSEFIEAAEQGSAISDLTAFALDSAMQALTVFRTVKPNFTLAVNLSPSLLDDPDLADQILEGIDSYGLDRSALILEITEAARLADRSAAMDMLDRLSKAGIPLSIDDYGTGRSTLDYLRVIPAKEIKLDRSFISDMIMNDQNRNLVESTIKLAQTLSLSTVAEGVENRETLNMLKSMGCTYVQGYHIGWPLGLEEFTRNFISNSDAYAA
jgi:diguanylate cyclase